MSGSEGLASQIAKVQLRGGPEASRKLLASSKLSKLGSEIEEGPIPDDSSIIKQIQSFTLISQSTDIGQEFQISKSTLNQEDTQSFFDICSDNLSILGLYGDREECYKVAMRFLQADHLPEIEGEEVLLCLYSPEDSRAALIYLTSLSTYKNKPIKSSSSSILFVKYLFDLCPIVVACPSSRLLKNWYHSDDPKLSNPFIVKDHIWGEVHININKAPEPKLMKLNLERPEATLPHVYIPGHRKNSYYEYDISVPNSYEIAIEVDRILHTAIQTNIKNLYNSPDRVDRFINSLEAEIASLSKTYSINWEQVSQHIKQAFDENKDMIDNIKKFHIEELYTKLKTMRFKDYVRKLGRRYSFSDSFDSLRVKILNTRTFEVSTSEPLFEKYLKKFMDQEDKEEQKNQICMGLNKCLVNIEKEIYSFLISKLTRRLKPIIKEGIQALENVYIRTCRLCEYNIEHNLDTNELILKITRKNVKLNTQIDYDNLKQIIQMGSFTYALFSNSGFTHILKLISNEGSLQESEECSKIPDEDCFIAWGSDLQQFVIFQNTRKVAYYGPVATTNKFDRGIEFPVYSDRRTIVKSAIYQTKKRKLIYINQDGHLFSYDLLVDTKIILPIKNEGSADSDNDFLKPRTGPKFLEIQSASNEHILFLRTESAIEIYDNKFVYLTEIQLNSDFYAFKTSFENGLHYIVIFEEPKVRCYYYRAAFESKTVANTPTAQREISGNPIADAIHLSLNKFGDSEILFNHKRELYFNIPDSRYEKIVIQYVNSLESIHKSIDFRGILKGSDISRIIRNPNWIQAVDFKWALYTRVPLHIASINNGNLYPMQNGFNYFENIISSQDNQGSFLDNLINELKFGHYEDILSEIKDIKVLSIIGRQSSGKSYLLNRLFATRFSVAAHRCTFGIWMNLAKLEGQYFVVFDCEGLFSIERKPQEEMKLCLFLSAISDVVILNQDLTFHRSLTELFEKITHGIDLINGSRLFKGKLEIVIRDVGKGEDDETIQQINSFIQRLIDERRDTFLHRLFGGVIDYSLYNNFESQDLFNQGLQDSREKYLKELKSRWSSGRKLLRAMKTVLRDIMLEDTI